MTVLLTLTMAGSDSGPFDLYSNLDSYTVPFEIGVSKASLLGGYSSVLVPDYTTIVRIKSSGTCINYVDILLSELTTTTSSTVAPIYNFLIKDCVTLANYNAVIGANPAIIGEVISYRPFSAPGSPLPRCGTIMSVTFPGPADASITGPDEGLIRACDDDIHCQDVV